MPQNLTERKSSLEQLFAEKAKQLQELENVKRDLFTDLLALKGKIDLLDEMIKDEEKNNQETTKKEDNTKKEQKDQSQPSDKA